MPLVDGDEGVYARLLQAIPAFFARITVDGQFLYLNRLAEGFTEDQVRGRSIFDFLHPRDHAAARACVEKVVATRAQHGYPSIGFGAHGDEVAYYTLISPIIEDDRVTSLALLATDVSPIIETHKALVESELKLRISLAASGMGIWTFDPTTKDGTWDATTAEMFGYPADPRTMHRQARLDHTHPDDVARVRAAFVRALETGVYEPIEHRVVRVDGSVRWVSARGRIQGAESARPGVLIGGVVDITQRRLQEERLAEAQMLESLGRLAGGVAHDFNNMLTAILAYSDLCIRAVPAGSTLGDDLREIRSAAERSRELTSRLLAFARKQPREPRIVEPNALVRQLERLLRQIVGEDITLVLSLRATRNLRVDPHQLEQLLVNLASNARDAMRAGGRLEVETTDIDQQVADGELLSGTYVRFRVTDTGTGIPAAVLPRVFEPFFTTKAVGQGTGLGLAQCYGIARQHGGAIRISSQEGAGTIVTLDLPSTTEPVVAATRAATAPGGAETILLVEDEPLVRTLAGRVLRGQGYQVVEASSGEEALDLEAASATIHLLITDMVMPGMKGPEVASRLRAARPAIPVILMSGYSDPEPAAALTPSRFLAKPFLPEELLAAVRAALDT
jgi:two-component system, cell cycle sensor histidine kinase and response regulator CckA